MLRDGTPCDYSPFECPYSAYTMTQCEYYCGEEVSYDYNGFKAKEIDKEEKIIVVFTPGLDPVDEF